MKKITAFKIKKLKDVEKLWLNELYRAFKEDRYGDHIKIKRKLWKKLPKHFDPFKINPDLAQASSITPIGIAHIDPEYNIFIKIDRILISLKEAIIEKYDQNEISISDLENSTGLNVDEIIKILNFIIRTSNSREFQNLSIDKKDDVNFISFRSSTIWDIILNYTDINVFIKNEFVRPKTDISKTPSANIHNLYTPNGVKMLDKERYNRFKPVFKTNVNEVDKKLCFVLMPFSEEWSSRVYKELIRENVEQLGLQCLRADNLTGQIIIEDIWTKINQCAFIIADVTNRNANVMYELGIVHTIGKPVILITQALNNIPFDFTHHRHHEYRDNTEGFRNFSEKLPDIIKDIYTDYYPEMIGLISN